MLRLVTCGSVDDGKSSLIGRLLFECGAVHADQLAALHADSARYGTRGAEPDYALLVDGLQAEREQGITIDVAYRYFGTARRRFIIADAPGHEQYTRNMVTGASTADVAVLLVDAQKGLLTQTRRHMYLARLMGIRHVVVAINKMDLVDYDQLVFDRISEQCRQFAATIAVAQLDIIPTSAVRGDNVRVRSRHMTWFGGPTLLSYLESVELEADRERKQPFRFPVQLVTRSADAQRGLAGTVVSGSVRCGDTVRILPSARHATVTTIFGGDGSRSEAIAGQAVTVTILENVDCSRGDLLASDTDLPEVADQLEATIVWLGEAPMLPGRSYWLKLAGQKTGAVVQAPKHRVNVDTLEQLATDTLSLNEIGVAHVLLDAPIAFEPYMQSRDLGGFILIDKLTRETVAAGLIHFALRRSHNVGWQALEIDQALRARMKDQRPVAIWLTGLSGAGKSTIANLVEQRLARLGRHTYLLDGDNVRHGLNRDLGFSDADRIENVRRVGEVARLMTDAGLIVLVAAISPFRAEREMVRQLFAPGEFLEVHVDVTLELAEARDPKGLYRKARAGSILNFTGIGSSYERPERPEVYIDTGKLTAEEAADLILSELNESAFAAQS